MQLQMQTAGAVGAAQRARVSLESERDRESEMESGNTTSVTWTIGLVRQKADLGNSSSTIR